MWRELAIKGLSEEHRTALSWFADHAGETRSWQDIETQADRGTRLATLAKGIYKPAYTDFALSVRQTLSSSYADKELVYRPDGTWVYPYFQENPDPSARDREATNRGLMKCFRENVPIGVMIQTKPKPGVEYLILGLGRVVIWEAGYFIIEKFELNRASDAQPDAAMDLVAAELQPVGPPPEIGVREWEIRQVLKRRGQARFRASLIVAYEGICAASGCDAHDALEAAHLAPYSVSANNNTSNGLLLRADLHSLFDLGLLAVHPDELTLLLSPKLSQTIYADLRGRNIRLPKNSADHPNVESLRNHALWARLL
jgi:putative restriction endonuclease